MARAAKKESFEEFMERAKKYQEEAKKINAGERDKIADKLEAVMLD